MRPIDTVEMTDDPDELFDLVDAEDRVIGQVRRGDAHRDPTLLHRSVQVLVFADDGRVLLQRRSQRKDLFPDYFCASASGHVISSDDYITTAYREVEEELGVRLALRFVEKTVVRSEFETEMTALFAARSNGPFHFNADETNGGEFFTLDELLPSPHARALPMTPALVAALAVIERLSRQGGLRSLLDSL